MRHYAATRDRKQDIFVVDRTFGVGLVFDKDRLATRCDSSVNGLLKPLLSASEAEYPIAKTGPVALNAPLSYRMLTDDWRGRQTTATKGYYSLRFTRVSLNPSKNEGFFGVVTDVCYSRESDTKYPIECGDGRRYFVHARKTDTADWSFETAKNCPIAIE